VTGTALLPRLIKAKDGEILPFDNPKSLGISNETLSKIRNGMDAAVNDPDGTAYKSRVINPNFRLAGKTGTAQVRRITEAEREIGVTKNDDLPWKRRDHALFTGYAPAKNPKFVISVIVEHGGGGSAVAAPIARDIMLYALDNKIPSVSSYPKDQRDDISIRLKQLKNISKKNKKINQSFGTQT
jgi:penicillin-binding protein 2